jgi:hypothetical protein
MQKEKKRKEPSSAETLQRQPRKQAFPSELNCLPYHELADCLYFITRRMVSSYLRKIVRMYLLVRSAA